MGRVTTSGDLRIDVHVGDGSVRSLPDDVLDGLTRPFKELPPKHLYDARGSELFDQICDLPEYYPTRTERSILDDCADLIVHRTGMAELVELGSGTAAKTRVLLSAMDRAGTLWRYVPFDVAEQVVRDCVAELADEYPALTLHGIVGDFDRHLGEIPPPERDRPRVVAFLGGTIGNFPPGARRRFLRSLSRLLSRGDYLLLGTDLVKDIDVLEAAYDDSEGVTAEFNRNVLHVLNRELDADFPTELFEHVAFFDPDREWIEMRLRARRACHVRLGALDLEVEFARGEELRTEISAKFTPRRLAADLAAARLEQVELFTDPERLFGLVLARPLAAHRTRRGERRIAIAA
jgi:L-histidine N-alpha-methyltransferase